MCRYCKLINDATLGYFYDGYLIDSNNNFLCNKLCNDCKPFHPFGKILFWIEEQDITLNSRDYYNTVLNFKYFKDFIRVINSDEDNYFNDLKFKNVIIYKILNNSKLKKNIYDFNMFLILKNKEHINYFSSKCNEIKSCKKVKYDNVDIKDSKSISKKIDNLEKDYVLKVHNINCDSLNIFRLSSSLLKSVRDCFGFNNFNIHSSIDNSKLILENDNNNIEIKNIMMNRHLMI